MWEVLTFNSPLAHRIQNIWVPLFTPPPPPPGVTPEQANEMYTNNMEDYLGRTRESVDRIRERGGRVIFLRFPSSDWIRESEREFSPRPGFWDQIIARSGAPGIHFEDYPQLSEFKCPEWSHLTGADAVKFSRRLMPILDQALNKSGS
jgi:hypothetical protein